MYKGVFLGLATADSIFYLPHHPGNNEKLKAERQLSFAGGPAANAAIAFAALGNRTTLITGLGVHPLAFIAKKDITDHQVHLIDCTDQPRRPPILAAIMVDLSSGERAVVYSNTDVRKLRSESISESILEDTDIVMLDGYYLPQAVQMAELARSLHIPVVLDGGSWKDGLDALLPLVDIAVCSSNFHPPGCTTSGEVFNCLQDYGIKAIAITRDGDPILACNQGNISEVPVMDVRVMDTLGAGDIFHGAFCHYILSHDFLLSLARAGEVASMACTSLGARAWIEQEKFP
jgi:sugar/nucleoside kinase (ribokinase family)